MTWQERKELENRKVVSLGGKVLLALNCLIFIVPMKLEDLQGLSFLCLPSQPSKKQRIPLSIARGMMKKQKERQHKMMQEVISVFYCLLYSIL